MTQISNQYWSLSLVENHKIQLSQKRGINELVVPRKRPCNMEFKWGKLLKRCVRVEEVKKSTRKYLSSYETLQQSPKQLTHRLHISLALSTTSWQETVETADSYENAGSVHHTRLLSSNRFLPPADVVTGSDRELELQTNRMVFIKNKFNNVLGNYLRQTKPIIVRIQVLAFGLKNINITVHTHEKKNLKK